MSVRLLLLCGCVRVGGYRMVSHGGDFDLVIVLL